MGTFKPFKMDAQTCVLNLIPNFFSVAIEKHDRKRIYFTSTRIHHKQNKLCIKKGGHHSVNSIFFMMVNQSQTIFTQKYTRKKEYYIGDNFTRKNKFDCNIQNKTKAFYSYKRNISFFYLEDNDWQFEFKKKDLINKNGYYIFFFTTSFCDIKI